MSKLNINRGNAIKLYLDNEGMTQVDLARELNLTHKAIGHWIKGKGISPKYDKILKPRYEPFMKDLKPEPSQTEDDSDHKYCVNLIKKIKAVPPGRDREYLDDKLKQLEKLADTLSSR